MRTIKRAMHFVFSAVLIGCGTFAMKPEAASQETGWITLFDGKDLDGWDQVGGSNWHVADGAIVADTMADKKEPVTVERTYSGHGAMSSYSLPEPTIGHARAAMLAVAFVSNIRQ